MTSATTLVPQGAPAATVAPAGTTVMPPQLTGAPATPAPVIYVEDEHGEWMEQLAYAPIWGVLLCLCIVTIASLWQWRRYKEKYDRQKRVDARDNEEMIKQLVEKFRTGQTGLAPQPGNTYVSPELSVTQSTVNEHHPVSPLLTFEPSSSSRTANSRMSKRKSQHEVSHRSNDTNLSPATRPPNEKDSKGLLSLEAPEPPEMSDLYSPVGEAHPDRILAVGAQRSAFPVKGRPLPSPASALKRVSSVNDNRALSCASLQVPPLPRPASVASLGHSPQSQNLSVPKTWQRGQLLGSGSYGNVYMGVRVNGAFFAAKVIPLNDTLPRERLVELKREVELMSALQHDNIVRYFGCSIDKDELIIFMEYVQGGSLGSLVRRHGQPLEETSVASYTRQILAGVDYLHSHSIIHRDLKGDNILWGEGGSIKLADFGTSKRINDTRITHLAGTPLWMSPEAIKGHIPITLKADIWSVGCVVCELLSCGKPPWPSEWESSWQALYTIGNWDKPMPPNLPEKLSPTAVDFLEQCFRIAPEERSDASDLQSHPFIAQTTDLDFAMLLEDSGYVAPSDGGGAGTASTPPRPPFRKASSHNHIGVVGSMEDPQNPGHLASHTQLSSFAFGERDSCGGGSASSDDAGGPHRDLDGRRKSSHFASDGDPRCRSVTEVLSDMIQASSPMASPAGKPAYACIGNAPKRNNPEPDWIRTASSLGFLDEEEGGGGGSDSGSEEDEETEAQAQAQAQAQLPVPSQMDLLPEAVQRTLTLSRQRLEEAAEAEGRGVAAVAAAAEAALSSSPPTHSPLLAQRKSPANPLTMPHSPVSPVMQPASAFSSALGERVPGSSPDTDESSTPAAPIARVLPFSGSPTTGLSVDLPERHQTSLLSPVGNPAHFAAALQSATTAL